MTTNIADLRRRQLNELRRRKRLLFRKKLHTLALKTRIALREERGSLIFYGALLVGIAALYLIT